MRVEALITDAILLASLVVLPAGVTWYFAQFGPPADGQTLRILAVAIMLPGPLLGVAALWVAAHS